MYAKTNMTAKSVLHYVQYVCIICVLKPTTVHTPLPPPVLVEESDYSVSSYNPPKPPVPPSSAGGPPRPSRPGVPSRPSGGPPPPHSSIRQTNSGSQLSDRPNIPRCVSMVFSLSCRIH